MPRGAPWLIAALVLFALGAWLVTRSEGNRSAERERRLAELDFPRHPRSQDLERQLRRRTLPPAPSPPAASGVPDEPKGQAGPRDPVLVALPPGAETALVLEASAIRESPVGRLLLRCVVAEKGDAFARMEKELGVDVLNDVDRVALASTGDRATFVLQGNLRGLTGKSLPGGPELRAQPWGDRGVVHSRAREGDGGASTADDYGLASWGENLAIVGDVKGLREAIDRLEGRGAAPAGPPIPEEESYGEVYGRLSPALAAEMLRELAGPVQAAARNIVLHVDTRDDVLLVADVDGPAPEPLSDLARALGGALSAARFAARAQDDDDVSELLELARVQPYHGSFRVEAALPLAWVERRLAHCGADAN